MVFGFFGKPRYVDEAAAVWLTETFAWALRNFDAEVFYDETRLVVPTNENFPGRADSSEGMARLIFDHVARYAGMGHWPFRVVDQAQCSIAPPARVEIRGALRGAKGVAAGDIDETHSLTVAYDRQLIGNPEALIATYAHTLAYYLGQLAKEPPPGGTDNWPQATEVVAAFMGFGLMFANSAFSVHVRSCASCGGPPAQRRAYLTQHQSTYALALFSVLKEIPNRTVVRHLKKSLRPCFRACGKEIRGKREAVERLRAISAEPTPLSTGALALPS
jgi:hypothetical protein